MFARFFPVKLGCEASGGRLFQPDQDQAAAVSAGSGSSGRLFQPDQDQAGGCFNAETTRMGRTTARITLNCRNQQEEVSVHLSAKSASFPR